MKDHILPFSITNYYLNFVFFLQVSPVIYKGIMVLLYKRHNTYLQLRSFCRTMKYNFFESYANQFFNTPFIQF